MRLALYSDLHLEIRSWTPPQLDVDVVLLAGDIHQYAEGLDWAATTFRRNGRAPTILYVASNHEYYRSHLGLLKQLSNPKWEKEGVIFLENRTVVIDGVRFLGCTLWSDFALYGDSEGAMIFAKHGTADFHVIADPGGLRFKPTDCHALHQESVRWLDQELAKPFVGKTVVIRHFAPDVRCVAARFDGSTLAPYFVTDLSGPMARHRIDLWCYGHTHSNIEFVADYGCRVVSNQRGYPTEQPDGFGPSRVIEV
jgi:predicted phosphohydrolase